MKQTKAQIKMMETIAVLGVFFVILVMGLIFYSRFQEVSIKKVGSEVFEQDIIRVVQLVSYMPEIQCATDQVTEFNCYDLYKLRAMQTLFEKDPVVAEYYFQVFEFSNVTIKKVFPLPEESITIYDRQPNDMTGIIFTRVPVSIFNPITRSYAFGYA